MELGSKVVPQLDKLVVVIAPPNGILMTMIQNFTLIRYLWCK